MRKVHEAPVAMLQQVESPVKIWYLPKEISQSSQGESQACTLIALQFLQNCLRSKLQFRLEFPSKEIVEEFSSSIDQGNNIYDSLRRSKKLQAKYLNIPEALEAIGSQDSKCLTEWKSFYFESPMQDSLHSNMRGVLKQWKRPSNATSDLHVVVVANYRAVIMVFSKHPKIVTLLDSHAHSPNGAVIATASYSHLDQLCKWYAVQLAKDTHPHSVDCYELSFLYQVKATN